MANEIQFHTLSGLTLDLLIFSKAGLVADADGNLEAHTIATFEDHVFPMTESPGGSGRYQASMPPIATAGVYTIRVTRRVGANADIEDPPAGVGEIGWDGTAVVDSQDIKASTDLIEAVKDQTDRIPEHPAVADSSGRVTLAPTGLDAIPITEPTGVATSFRQMLVQLWRRFFGATILSKTQDGKGELLTYASDGVTPITTQEVTESDVAEVQGEAEDA